MSVNESATDEYSEMQWAEAAGHAPLAGLDVNQIFLLQRHWMWANLQRHRFYETSPTAAKPDGGAFLADESWSCMYLWYALLWSVLEGFSDRRVELRGQLAADIEELSDPLRRCRNVVFHVSKKNQNDARLFEILNVPGVVAKVRRVHAALGRLFLEEHDRYVEDGRIPT